MTLSNEILSSSFQEIIMFMLDIFFTRELTNTEHQMEFDESSLAKTDHENEKVLYALSAYYSD